MIDILLNRKKDLHVYEDWNDMMANSDNADLQKAFDYVAENHTIIQTVNDIEDIIYEKV